MGQRQLRNGVGGGTRGILHGDAVCLGIGHVDVVDADAALDQDSFRRLLLQKAAEVKGKADVILLAQGSMAYVEEDICREHGITTLSSPGFGAVELKKALEKKGLL